MQSPVSCFRFLVYIVPFQILIEIEAFLFILSTLIVIHSREVSGSTKKAACIVSEMLYVL